MRAEFQWNFLQLSMKFGRDMEKKKGHKTGLKMARTKHDVLVAYPDKLVKEMKRLNKGAKVMVRPKGPEGNRFFLN